MGAMKRSHAHAAIVDFMGVKFFDTIIEDRSAQVWETYNASLLGPRISMK
jgi:hypothetical protein